MIGSMLRDSRGRWETRSHLQKGQTNNPETSVGLVMMRANTLDLTLLSNGLPMEQNFGSLRRSLTNFPSHFCPDNSIINFDSTRLKFMPPIYKTFSVLLNLILFSYF